ncbi:FIG110192: hypothetical protein [hydrothermal vent metagenome]|uniref:COGs COG3146 n=1 Tax=hydrothermal vent metagenome TaxID=652676 RepID=A0A3B0ZXF8_9ZZZZ
MRAEIIEKLSTINLIDWNRVAGPTNPFIQYEFLIALENNRCLDEYGWHSRHIVLYDDDDQLVAAMPMYLKDNSYGELVFDWAWADAYHRAGIPYYPKLVTAIPYTPATGPRILVDENQDYETCAKQLTHFAIKHAESINASSLHWLFTNKRDTDFLRSQGHPMRLGCQFHWQNLPYENFDDFLSHMSSSKRKKIKRERRQVKEQGIEIEIRHGDEMDDSLWKIYHDFYTSTFDKKSGMATLSRDFFQELGETMPRNVVIVFAKYQNQYIASAFNLRDQTTLYGRHWGCSEEFHSLHFEACYYQGLDYCIQHGLQRFEPGAQGEHKISRGFLPSDTWSAHWIAHPEFNQVIQNYTQQEQQGMQHYIDSLCDHSPFKLG